jgi:photosystem II stability/assembly factor-like uncharacterized protein
MRAYAAFGVALGILAAQAALAVDLHEIFHNANTYGAARDDGSVSRSGTGGVVFTVQGTGDNGALYGVAYHTNLFVAVGEGGRVVRATTGLSWSPEDSRTTATLRRITPHGSYLIAVGDAGTTLRRIATATVWDTTASPGSADLYGVASNGSTIAIAVGDFGTVLRSTDNGLTWQGQTLPQAPHMRGVTASGAVDNIFVAVGLGGVIFRSTNYGVDWDLIQSPTAEDLFDVTSDAANRIVAVGANGTILRALNGGDSGSWQQAIWGLVFTLRGAHHDGTYFYAVGAQETIARSLDGVAWFRVPVVSDTWGDVKTRYR